MNANSVPNNSVPYNESIKNPAKIISIGLNKNNNIKENKIGIYQGKIKTLPNKSIFNIILNVLLLFI